MAMLKLAAIVSEELQISPGIWYKYIMNVWKKYVEVITVWLFGWQVYCLHFHILNVTTGSRIFY